MMAGIYSFSPSNTYTMSRPSILSLSLLPPVSPFSESSNSSMDDAIRQASQAVISSEQSTTPVNDQLPNDTLVTDQSETNRTASPQSLHSDTSSQSDSSKSNYQRYPKPPYSYLGMIIMAIEISPEKALTLSEIYLSISHMFPFFRGSYKGWKDSVRHTLSYSACFYKSSRGRSRKWAVNFTAVPENALRRQETSVSRSSYWPQTLCGYLGVPEITLPCTKPAVSIQKTRPSNTDFSINRILTHTPELVDDTRPLQLDDTPPSCSKMSLKLQTRSARRQQNSPLYRLVRDSATRWGVSEETAIDQLKALCKIMDTTSALTQQQQSHHTQYYSPCMYQQPTPHEQYVAQQYNQQQQYQQLVAQQYNQYQQYSDFAFQQQMYQYQLYQQQIAAQCYAGSVYYPQTTDAAVDLSQQ